MVQFKIRIGCFKRRHKNKFKEAGNGRLYEPKKSDMGGSPGLVVKGGDS